MAQDGVSAEVLYPTLALSLFSITDVELQQACFTVYNDWIAEYCHACPDRLIGVGLVSTYETDHAVFELRRCRELGLRGVQVWQTPPEGLSFATGHYDPLWAAAAECGLPVSLHILTGFDWSLRVSAATRGDSTDGTDLGKGVETFGFRGMANLKVLAAMNALHDLILSGALHRHPDLRIVLVENEIGWIPFILDQWDKYYNRPQFRPPEIDCRPSEYFLRQAFATFFNDRPGTRALAWWGESNCLWSNDYPHPNSTWPQSRQVIADHLGHLALSARRKVTMENCAGLYGLDVLPI
jgi:predicted TIM-barrel fold metal-dependent hydrolase